MKYEIKRDNYRNFNVFEINRLEPRAYFIPFDRESDARECRFTQDREKSGRIQMLSGEWDFRYYPKCSALPETIETDDLDWDKISVPSTWQHTGYEKPFYLNRRYQFPKKPPEIPSDIPVGIYRKAFDFAPDGVSTLTFLGVCACAEVYVNGAFVGYTEGSHNKAEFDISEFLKDGQNEIVVAVYKFSNGSYLECQDMYRENGIFRDVYITKEGKEYFRDLNVRTKKRADGKYDLQIAADCVGGKEISVTLRDGEKILVSDNREIEGGRACIKFESLSVEEWSAEIPKLYELVAEQKKANGSEFVRIFVGFKDIKIDGNVFLFNGKKIKMKGVNHHDSDPVKGYAVGACEHERDIKLMKSYNVNTVRLSHYPKDPVFLALCDFYGLYVVDEADIETHGFYNVPSSASANRLSNDPKWKAHYLDRVNAMLKNDANHCCIAMWSLGNESGGWKNQDACAELIKSFSDVPVHYEGASHNVRGHYDVASEMYPKHAKLKAVADMTADKIFTEVPYFMCEYAHSMGVGAGSLDDYWDIIYSADNLLGGCIWEFCDHSAYIENGKYKWTYGGDFGEFIHDKNFCVDGLFYPDRRPHSGALQMKYVYRPLLASFENGKFEFQNTRSFKDSSDISVNYTVSSGGLATARGKLDLSVPPAGKTVVDIPFENKPDTSIIFEYTNKTDGTIVAKEEISLTPVACADGYSGSPAPYEQTKGEIRVAFEGGSLVVDKKKGAITRLKIGEKEFLAGEIRPNITRAPIDNEMFIGILFKIIGFNRNAYKCKFAGVSVKNGATVLRFKCKARLNLGSIRFGMEVKVFADGAILIEYTRKNSCLAMREIPKIGLLAVADKRFDKIVYFGKNGESYPDFADFRTTEITALDAADFFEPYIKPQENGNRMFTRWAQITDEEGDGFKISAVGKPFGFGCHDYSTAGLLKAGHIEDLDRGEALELYFDGYTRPVGSNSCGPLPLSKYKYDGQKKFAVLIQPLKGERLNKR